MSLMSSPSTRCGWWHGPKRNLVGLVSDGESILEAIVTVPELTKSPLFRLSALAMDFLTATGIDA